MTTVRSLIKTRDGATSKKRITTERDSFLIYVSCQSDGIEVGKMSSDAMK